MPNTRHQRNHRQREEDTHNNNQHAPVVPAANQRDVAAGAGNAMGPYVRQNDNAAARLQKCCTPGSCRCPDETIDPEDPYDSVRVLCNNENCVEGIWMHKDCFEEFEQSVLAYLRSCGRARSWSEKQRLQNLWTKKGYDLAFKACDCKCGRGHLRKDLDYIPPPFNANAKKQKKHKKKNDKPMPVVSTTHKSNSHSNHVGHMNGNVLSSATTNQPTANRGQQNPVSTSGGRTSAKTTQKSKKTSTTPKPEALRNDNDQQQDVLDNHSSGSSTSVTNPPPDHYHQQQPHPQWICAKQCKSSAQAPHQQCQ